MNVSEKNLAGNSLNKSSNFLIYILFLIIDLQFRYIHFISDKVLFLNLNNSGSNTKPFNFSISEIQSSINCIIKFDLSSFSSKTKYFEYNDSLLIIFIYILLNIKFIFIFSFELKSFKIFKLSNVKNKVISFNDFNS